ncbi:metabolite traffic protein EboE [Frankia sp. Cppng1_Ct_nod]|uniref:metabolite traffic protein EboE n=1 Tax=Frankia sp. Cppng1_Ct_nod TaxID=2897162 RepID=UPI001041204C|nr:metabolite traffic protein EboE [Frankia sp. Cppng1_Ct_nod]
MRFRHSDGTILHVAYCTNVHPAEDLDGVLDQLERYAEPIRRRLGTEMIGLGLWLAHDVAAALDGNPAHLKRLRADLDARGLEVVTLNGFPYRHFHAPVVKHAVYTPDWSQPERLAYTLRLARLLTRLLPADAARGSISTLPLGWRSTWDGDRRDAAARNLVALADELAVLEERTGRRVRIGFEPEPGCVLETTSDGARHLGDVDRSRLGICVDACHLAVAFEEPAAAVRTLAAAGLPVVKLQASSALHADDPADTRVRESLRAFVEPRFLHQTREPTAGPADSPEILLDARDDLPDALSGESPLPARGPWRVHFHLPLHAVPTKPLASTRDVLIGVLAALIGGEHALTDHIEVETYTWTSLPQQDRPVDETSLVHGIAAELDWIRAELVRQGLREVTS